MVADYLMNARQCDLDELNDVSCGDTSSLRLNSMSANATNDAGSMAMMATSASDQEYADLTHCSLYRFCRAGKRIVRDARDRAIRALQFAKLLTVDLEICAKFQLAQGQTVMTLMQRLYDTDHVMIVTPSVQQSADAVTPSSPMGDYVMFCERSVADDDDHLQLLLNMTCGRDDQEVPEHLAGRPGYLLLSSSTPLEKACWPGVVRTVIPDPDTKLSLQYMQVDAVYLVVVNSKTLSSQREALRRHISDEYIHIVDDQCSCHEIIAQDMNELKATAMKIRAELAQTAEYLQENMLDEQDIAQLDNNQRQTYRDTVVQAYNLVFDYHRELARLVSAQLRPRLARATVDVLDQWSRFVQMAFQRGHRAVPRWAHHSLNFFVVAMNPDVFTKYLSEEEFRRLKKIIDDTVCHIVGETAALPCPQLPPTAVAMAQAISNGTAQPRRQSPMFDTAALKRGRAPNSASTSETDVDTSGRIHHVESAIGVLQPPPLRIMSPLAKSSPSSSHNQPQQQQQQQLFSPPPSPPTQRQRRDRQRQLLAQIDTTRTRRLRTERRIGREVDTKSVTVAHIEGRRAPFPWQRMEKMIGRGKFGTVYTAINQRTTPLMAMKQIERRDQRELLSLIDEVKNLTGINHPNLVRYYGYEVHRVCFPYFHHTAVRMSCSSSWSTATRARWRRCAPS